MKKIDLTQFQHHAASQIGIHFSFDREMIEFIKLLKNISWSQTFGCFYFLANRFNLESFMVHMQGKNYLVDDSAINHIQLSRHIPSENDLLETRIELFKNYLTGKRYSESTIATYLSFTGKFIRFHKDTEDYTLRDVDRFVEKEIAGKRYAISSHRQCISALKHYFDFIELDSFDTSLLNRPEKSKFLPGVLSKEEVLDLLRATRNLKHRSILALIYSSGLRIGELLNLRLDHIDVDRKQILIKQAKGRKDRYVLLAESFIPLLYNYLQTYKPQIYFTEGQNNGQYTASSIRAFLKDSVKRAGIRKRVTPHTLRHSYATHMLENGIDIRYIQELLGHSRPETTMIYTHVTQKDLMKIRSPLDESLKELMDRNKDNPNLRLSRNLLG
ncbi:site-specific tyrosine recombinase/integron integrase [Gramella sp. AN32]|uniref:Site-specific tyrosine recombinase/integron integrase n=1 Tax=Christiangramia antarctica TaxID=2058158 RepID=A0ABW5XAS9_9FLAO|nr:site-specific tyrosine recombinase/integron integrase [Gramella sp. AN32]MCM4158160.1 integrase [Gramella sp. AN32]